MKKVDYLELSGRTRICSKAIWCNSKLVYSTQGADQCRRGDALDDYYVQVMNLQAFFPHAEPLLQPGLLQNMAM
jgi:hypothetical protein